MPQYRKSSCSQHSYHPIRRLMLLCLTLLHRCTFDRLLPIHQRLILLPYASPYEWSSSADRAYMKAAVPLTGSAGFAISFYLKQSQTSCHNLTYTIYQQFSMQPHLVMHFLPCLNCSTTNVYRKIP